MVGRRHVIAETFRRIALILEGMGYRLARGPEVELEYYNFQALNFPDEHPSRDLQDTFYVSDDILLRTHTSPIQVRFMEEHKPPLKIYAPGRVYRNEAIDASHQAEFHQVEGLYIDTDVTMADLRGDLLLFLRELFGRGHSGALQAALLSVHRAERRRRHVVLRVQRQRLRDLRADRLDRDSGGRHGAPECAARASGYDPDQYSGFAFGVGVDRIAMIRHGIPDIRMFLENDLRFLEQFQEPGDFVIVSFSWLRRTSTSTSTRATLAHDLTMHGVKVERLTSRGLTERAGRGRPRAGSRDRTRTRIACACAASTWASGDPLEIVCGAPNVAAGQRVAVGTGGRPAPNGLKIRKSKIRGVTSNGMICSQVELGLGAEIAAASWCSRTTRPSRTPLADVLGPDRRDARARDHAEPARPACHTSASRAKSRPFYRTPLRLPAMRPS